MPMALAPISDQALVKKVNTQIRSTDVTLRKADDAYVLAFDENISAVDSFLYLAAVNKRSKKATKIAISINSLGQAVAVTKVDLKKFNVFIKRGKSTLNKVKIGQPAP
jgi:CRISPR/Cas system-associated protein Cas5 (RAMP superfamily)